MTVYLTRSAMASAVPVRSSALQDGCPKHPLTLEGPAPTSWAPGQRRVMVHAAAEPDEASTEREGKSILPPRCGSSDLPELQTIDRRRPGRPPRGSAPHPAECP